MTKNRSLPLTGRGGGAAVKSMTSLLLTGWLTLQAVATDAVAEPLPAAGSQCAPLFDHHLRPLTGAAEERLCDRFAGQVVLVVNTASQCGYTGQLAGLETIWQRYRDQGLLVAGFPSNDFAGQDPGSEQAIADFCRIHYGVTFPMYQKIHVRQGGAHPLYDGLAASSGHYPGWNFHKYLIGRDGELVASWPSSVEPEASELVAAIEQALANQ